MTTTAESLDDLAEQFTHYAAKLAAADDPITAYVLRDRIDRILDARLRLDQA